MWSRQPLNPGILPAGSAISTYLDIALSVINNIAHNPSQGLSDRAKLEASFHAVLLAEGRLSDYYFGMEDAVRQVMKKPPDKRYNKWDWAASRLTVLPIGTRLGALRAVFLGPDSAPLSTPPFIPTRALADALITFAQKKIDPQSYGRGEALPPDQSANFMTALTEIYRQPRLFNDLQVQYRISRPDLIRQIAEFAVLRLPHLSIAAVTSELT